MKSFLLALVLVLTPFSVAMAQAKATQPSSVVAGNKDALDLAQTKLENIQLKAARVQEQTKALLNELGKEYTDEQAVYQRLIDGERNRLKLPASATYDPATFSFTLPPEPAPAKK